MSVRNQLNAAALNGSVPRSLNERNAGFESARVSSCTLLCWCLSSRAKLTGGRILHYAMHGKWPMRQKWKIFDGCKQAQYTTASSWYQLNISFHIFLPSFGWREPDFSRWQLTTLLVTCLKAQAWFPDHGKNTGSSRFTVSYVLFIIVLQHTITALPHKQLCSKPLLRLPEYHLRMASDDDCLSSASREAYRAARRVGRLKMKPVCVGL